MKIFSVLLAFVVLSIFGTDLNAQQISIAEVGKKAPHFELRDVDGKIHNLADYSGKTIVLEWINFDCPFVVKHYGSGNMQELQKEYTQKGVVWFSICSSAPGKQGHFDNEEIKNRIKKSDASMTSYLIDETGLVGKLYSAKTTPHMFIINQDGKLVYQGAIDNIKSTEKADVVKANNFVREALEEILNGKPVTNSTTTPYGCSVKYNQ